MTGPGVPVWGPFLSLPMRKVGERLSRTPKRLDAGAKCHGLSVAMTLGQS